MTHWVQRAVILLAMAALTSARKVPAAEPTPPWPVPISKATTFVTEPLRADGSVDYAAALNKQLSKGVTPENNAAVILAEVDGLYGVTEKLRPEIARQLGLKEVPAKPLFIDWYEYVQKEKTAGRLPEDFEEDEEYDKALADPWSAKDLPHVDAWLTLNESALRRAAEAATRPRYWWPLIPDANDGKYDGLLFSAILQNTKPIFRAFVVRAGRDLQDGKIDNCRADLLRCRQISTQIGHGQLLITNLLNYVGHNMANTWACRVAEQTQVSPAAAKTWIAEIREHSAPSMSAVLDFSERLFILDGAQAILRTSWIPSASNVQNRWLPSLTVSWQQIAVVSAIDWSDTFRRLNESLDRIVAVANENDPHVRLQQFAEFDREQSNLLASRKTSSYLVNLYRESPNVRIANARFMHDALVLLLTPGQNLTVKAEVHYLVHQDLTTLAIALSGYRTEHGEYPEKLQSLSPEYFAKLPVDPYGDGPYKYRRTADGFVLYSFSDNERDDGGVTDPEDPYERGDIVVRVPSRDTVKPSNK